MPRQEARRSQRRAWKACTMSSISQSVPEPLRRTSSGGMGMMVDRLKMKGWM